MVGINKMPPANIAVEYELLYIIYGLDEKQFKNVMVNINLKPEHFYVETCRDLFGEALNSLAGNLAPSHSLVMGKYNKREDIKGFFDNFSKKENVSQVQNLSAEIKQQAERRKYITAGSAIINCAYDTKINIGNIREQVEKFAYESVMIADTRMEHIGEALSKAVDMVHLRIKRYNEGDEVNPERVPTGIAKIDHLLHGGFGSTNLITVAGGSSVGKTQLATQFLLSAAIKKKVPVAIFSLEMGREEIVVRLLSQLSGVSHDKLLNGMVTSSDFGKLDEASKMLDSSCIHIDDGSMLNFRDIGTESKKLKIKYPNLGLVIVDYIQLVIGDQSGNREQEVASISRYLKGLSKSIQVPVIQLSQLNADQMQNNQSQTTRLRKLRASDLRESKAIYNDSDVVIFIDLPYRFMKGGNRRQAELVIDKNRGGALGEIELFNHYETLTFEVQEEKQEGLI